MSLYLTLFLLGLFGATHCVLMCGGISATLSAALDKKIRDNNRYALLYQLLYQLGRITSYVVLGLIFGTIGYLLSLTPLLLTLRIFSGVIIIAAGLYITNWWLGLSKLEHIGATLWRHLEKKAQKILPLTCKRHAFIAGLFWGMLPCGLVYSALTITLSASTSATNGAFMMFFFALGTLPNLLFMSFLSVYLMRLISQNWLRQFVGVLIIILGIQAIITPLLEIGEHKHSSTNVIGKIL